MVDGGFFGGVITALFMVVWFSRDVKPAQAHTRTQPHTLAQRKRSRRIAMFACAGFFTAAWAVAPMTAMNPFGIEDLLVISVPFVFMYIGIGVNATMQAIDYGLTRYTIRICTYAVICVVPSILAWFCFFAIGMTVRGEEMRNDLKEFKGAYPFVAALHTTGMFLLAVAALFSWTAPMAIVVKFFEKYVVSRFPETPAPAIVEGPPPAPAHST